MKEMKEMKEIKEMKGDELKKLPTEDIAELKIGSSLPTSELEYTDGNEWYSLATKNYVNMVAKKACRLATTENLVADYAQPLFSQKQLDNNLTIDPGVGTMLTRSSTANPQPPYQLVIDGFIVELGDRVLVANQTNSYENGIYKMTTVGNNTVNWVLTRATDYDSKYLINPGDDIAIVQGAYHGNTSFMQTATVTTIGVSPIIFESFSRIGVLDITGTTNQIVISGTPTNAIVSMADNPVIAGTAGITLPGGTTNQRPISPAPGTLRYHKAAV